MSTNTHPKPSSTSVLVSTHLDSDGGRRGEQGRHLRGHQHGGEESRATSLQLAGTCQGQTGYHQEATRQLGPRHLPPEHHLRGKKETFIM